MLKTHHSTFCATCGSNVELPANFCDMCGKRLAESTATKWKRQVVRLVIPAVMAGFVLYLLIFLLSAAFHPWAR